MKKLDLYIIKKYLSSFFFTMLLISMVAVVIDFSEKVNRFIDARLDFIDVLTTYYLNFIPWINGMIWPLFSLIAVIFFTSRMAKNSEIVAMLSSGVSLNRIMIPYLIAAGLVAGMLWFGKNHLIPHSCKIKNEFENEYLKKNSKKTLHNDIHFFLSPNEKFYTRYYRKRDTTGQTVRLESFQDSRLVRVLSAERIVFKEQPNVWTLVDYTERSFNDLDEALVVHKGEKLDTVLDLTPEDFVRNTKLMENMTTRDLNDYIDRARERGLGDSKAFLIEKHLRNSQPFTILILTIIGFAVSARKVRGGMGFHLAVGVILGAAFVIISKFAATFSNNMNLSPALGAWLPNIIFLAVALFIVKYSQK